MPGDQFRFAIAVCVDMGGKARQGKARQGKRERGACIGICFPLKQGRFSCTCSIFIFTSGEKEWVYSDVFPTITLLALVQRLSPCQTHVAVLEEEKKKRQNKGKRYP
jgi:hypothetical protein